MSGTIKVTIRTEDLKAVYPMSLPGGYSSPPPQTVAVGGTVAIPEGKLLLGIAFDADASLRTISIGTSANATNVADNEEISPSQPYFYGCSIYFQQAGTLHFSGASATVRIYLL
jgi:hypothetical protein